MINIIMHGCNGKMGQVITGLAANDDNVAIVAGVDINTEANNGYPVFKSIKECDVNADVIIDFSATACMDDLFEYCGEKKIPVVVCTTGLSEEQMDKLTETSKKVAVLKSANMSLGINTICDVLTSISALLSDAGFDIEIVEKHHNKKVDAPSGTALALADTINEATDNKFEYVYDRSTKRESRGANELGISAVRGGTIVGEHEIIFAGTDEVIEIKHTAYSKAIFAKGAIEAARFLAGKPAGLYNMKDVISRNR